ncbi:xanthine dehydrogenase family protein molybdopterin-binding subunit [Nocardioides islandensis]|uniref:Xanthine dehydrogenase family protein molybdopterin-binding subunit n=1 Tax=Nocardioides islandensis TaxID=433663 RepID=A0A930YLN1_9ACTN|nr:xanthine dehydrogenase family protein molybdopterin-binding subunit [Nocardioides islandensis]MBF4764790.1 xanthine dehydrogenase family protein molybdopterin-binding subunit [Nocardioides islandensis]
MPEGTSLLGTQVRRVEDPELLVGKGTFVDNTQDETLAHAVFVRSPFAHARITGIDTSEAEAAPGVLAVYTSADLGDDPVPAFAVINKLAPRYALARDKARYVGDPVALVVAESRAAAVDAAELVDVDYDDLPAVSDVEAALAADAPLQFEEIGSNIAVRRHGKDRSDPFEGADHVTRVRMVNQRIATAPIEGNAIIVRPDGPSVGPDHVSAWVSTQHPHLSRDLLAETLGLEEDQVRVVAPHVGGAFGGKAGIGPDHAAVALAAVRLGRGVKWVETRSEAMLSMQGRGQVQYAELGLTSEGRIVGLRLRMIGECGAYAGFGGSFPTGSTYIMAQGTYVIPELRYDGIGVLTNTAPVGAFRGAGRPEAAACLERLMDVAADELGIAPEEIRRRNFIAPDAFPYKTKTGMTYDNGDYDLPLREALRIADVDGARAEQRRRIDAGETKLLGIGIATYVEITGFGGSELGQVEVHADGSATVRSGTSAHGQGHATSFSMIVSDRLGIPMEKIRYEQSDTAIIPTGGGTGGSRSLQIGGSAVGKAADELREKAIEIAARMLEAAPEDVVLDGDFSVAGVPGSSIGWTELAAYAHDQEGGLGVVTDYRLPSATFPFGAHVSIVEVDTETGRVRPLRHVAVDDCGRIVNPLLVAGQQHGGAVQGISQALWEEMVYDENGTPITATFVDYALPTAADVIQLETSNTETPTPVNPLGAKGIGESATIGSTPAVQNAVVDALSHLGVRHIDLPCTAERVWLAANGHGPDQWREPPDVFEPPEGEDDEEPEMVEA